MLSILLLLTFVSQGRCFNRAAPSSLAFMSPAAGISKRKDFILRTQIINSHHLHNVVFSNNEFFNQSLLFYKNKSSSKLNGSKLDDDLFDDLSDGENSNSSSDGNGDDNVSIELLPLADGEELSDEILAQLEQGQPSELAIMKELLGINGFTYLLAGLIILFLSLNALLGPGWLGQIIGLEGTGTFTQVSDSLPGTVDLNSPENLL